jgi:hypothetical protein
MITSILVSFFLLAPQTLSVGGGTKQLIDNQRVTVWETTGAATEVAKNDRVSVDLIKAGNAAFTNKGETQPSMLHSVIIDLKDLNSPPVPNNSGYPLAFPRYGVKKVLENNRVIIWDYTWIPGRPTVMHFHDKDVVVVYMADGKLKSTTPDGKSVVNTISFGLTTFNAPNRSHSEELVEGLARAVIVEFK